MLRAHVHVHPPKGLAGLAVTRGAPVDVRPWSRPALPEFGATPPPGGQFLCRTTARVSKWPRILCVYLSASLSCSSADSEARIPDRNLAFGTV